MPSVPAFCDTCGTVFHSGVIAENSSIGFSNVLSGPCPKCGGTGHIPDGVFNFIGNTIEILSAPERTIKELTQLAQILQDAKVKGETPEAVIARIHQELPSLSRMADLLPKNRSELYGFLALILTVVQLMSQPAQTSHTININQVIQQVIPAPDVQQPTHHSQEPNKKIGRNEPCSCGSGKKYKRCCGAPN